MTVNESKKERIEKLEKEGARVALIVIIGLIIEFSLAIFLAFHTLKVNPNIGKFSEEQQFFENLKDKNYDKRKHN